MFQVVVTIQLDAYALNISLAIFEVLYKTRDPIFTLLQLQFGRSYTHCENGLGF